MEKGLIEPMHSCMFDLMDMNHSWSSTANTTLAFFSLLCYTTEEGQKNLVSPGGTEMMSSQ